MGKLSGRQASGTMAVRYLGSCCWPLPAACICRSTSDGFTSRMRRFHWRQLIVAIEIILLFVVGFLPQDMNMAANIIVSFVCALQVNAFRKIKGSPYATTMCIGNLRSATENLYWYRHTGKKDHRDKCIRYYGVIGIFAVGAVMGSVLTAYLRERTIWVSCGLLLVSFLIMFVKEDIEGGHR
ncbi:MAG: YoaK family protein [Enterocloster bolteae]